MSALYHKTDATNPFVCGNGFGCAMYSRLSTVAVAAGVALLSGLSPALAGSMKDAPVPKRAKGFYVGVHGGITSGDHDHRVQSVGDVFFKKDGAQYAVERDGKGSLDSDTEFLGGLQVGYNFFSKPSYEPMKLGHGHRSGGAHHGRWRLFSGIEADISFMDHTSSGVFAGTFNRPQPNSFTMKTEVDTNWIATVRKRLGLKKDRWLVYVTAGLAIGDIDMKSSYRDDVAPNFANASSSNTKVGWVAGAGAEYALTKNWSLKAEYLFVDLGRVSHDATLIEPNGPAVPPKVLRFTTDVEHHIARIGLNYQF